MNAALTFYKMKQETDQSNGKFQGESNLKTDISSVMFSGLHKHVS